MISRRKFVGTVAATGAGLVIVPRHVLGRGFQAPSDTLNVAIVGIGGMGASNATALMSQNLVAFCDVDWNYAGARVERFKTAANAAPSAGQSNQPARPAPAKSKAQLAANEKRAAFNSSDKQRENLKRFVEQQLPKVQRYKDYREMLAKQKDIDGVVVATPDHMHAAIGLAAMDLGKHVYIQKPLCWSVEEARQLAKKAADNPKLVTQMGNQGHSSDGARTGYESIAAGAIGDIREVHVWTNRPLGFWPQGIPRPGVPAAPAVNAASPPAQPFNGREVEKRLAAALAGKYPVPDQLDWDLFLGVAPAVEYHPIYHPFNWRGWVDWGQGALGDMGAHLVDHPFWALDLGYPTTIETLSTPFNGVCFPTATTTYYQFPARGSKPAVKLTWYDGGLTPAKPEEMGEEKLNGEGGILYIGSKGKMMQDTYGARPRLLPQSLHDSVGAPAPKLSRIVHEEHEMNWVEAIKGKAEISSPFSFAGPLTEVMLLGVAALRAGTKLHYDGDAMRVTNNAAANEFLKRQYRQGWTL